MSVETDLDSAWVSFVGVCQKYINSLCKLKNTFAFHVDACNCLDGSDNPNPGAKIQQKIWELNGNDASVRGKSG